MMTSLSKLHRGITTSHDNPSQTQMTQKPAGVEGHQGPKKNSHLLQFPLRLVPLPTKIKVPVEFACMRLRKKLISASVLLAKNKLQYIAHAQDPSSSASVQ